MAPRRSADDDRRGRDEWPAYLAYVTSFLTVGGIWLSHHGLFSRLRYVDGLLLRINLAPAAD